MVAKVSRRELTRFKQDAADAKWLMQNYDQYRPKYGGTYVAVHKGRIVDHNKDLIQLRDRIGASPAFIQFIYKQKPELIL